VSAVTGQLDTRPTTDAEEDLAVTEAGGDGQQIHQRAAARWMIGAIHGYQMLRTGRPTGCRYLPTCSEYAVLAIERFGAARGASLAARRLVRCNPWGGHGVDPVPEGKVPCSPH
jgi:uncharacterized protein